MKSLLHFWLITLAFILTPFNSQAADGHVKFIKGKASVAGKILKKGSPISYKNIVKTDKKSLIVLQINPGVILKIKENSSVTINKPVKSKKGKFIINKYLLNKGQMFIKAKRTEKHRFRVGAGSAVMGVRGTQFFVTNSGEKKQTKIWMCVNEGQVSVKVGKAKWTVLVNKGEGVFINSDKLPTKRAYNWTKKLNWKTDGSYNEIKDTIQIDKIKYNPDEFDYD